MISTVLANTGPWSDVVLAVLAFGLVLVGRLLAARGARGRRAAGLVAVLSTLAALAFALTPESGATVRQLCWVGDGVPQLGDTANIAMLFPAALFGTIATRAPLPVLAAVAGLSALLETVQALLPVLLNRSCDLNDWYTNTLGAIAGVLLGAVLVAIAGRRGLRESAVHGSAGERPREPVGDRR